MAPSTKEIESVLRAFIQETINDGKEDLLTVRYVRNKVVESLGLDEGFFVTEEWKDRSKGFIKACAVSCNHSQLMRWNLLIHCLLRTS
jgi:hypothetical protein